MSFAGTASAASINIMAIGASNTAGKGVGGGESWPEVLERLLKNKGYDVHMTVRAANGLTSAQILGYTDSIPAGTQVVIYDTGVSNDARRNVSTSDRAANISAIASRIRAHGAVAIKAPYGSGAGRYEKQGDAVHFTPAAHAKIAAILLPRVLAAARRH